MNKVWLVQFWDYAPMAYAEDTDIRNLAFQRWWASGNSMDDLVVTGEDNWVRAEVNGMGIFVDAVLVEVNTFSPALDVPVLT